MFLELFATAGSQAQTLTTFRIANGTSGETPAVLWLGIDQGFNRKHGLNVEAIFMRSGPLAMSALASADVQSDYYAKKSPSMMNQEEIRFAAAI